jgi:hypothetical protein
MGKQMRQLKEEDIGAFGVRGPHLTQEGEVNVATVEKVRLWILENCEVSVRVSQKLSSYAWKHIAEAELRGYVSNGAFIVAALRAGAKAEAGPNTPNALLSLRLKKKRTTPIRP